jgi:hypothetical protein
VCAGAPPGGVSPLSWPVGTSSSGAQSIGITTVRTLASVGAAYLVVPAHESRLLAPGAVLQQLPPGGSSACHEHPPSLAHCLHSSGPACPVASAFVVLGATQAAMTEYLQRGIKEDWPSTIQIGLIAHYGGGSPRVGGTCPQQDVVGPPSSGRLVNQISLWRSTKHCKLLHPRCMHFLGLQLPSRMFTITILLFLSIVKSFNAFNGCLVSWTQRWDHPCLLNHFSRSKTHSEGFVQGSWGGRGLDWMELSLGVDDDQVYFVQ